MRWLHVHLYRIEEDWTEHSRYGVICARRVKRCRCGSSKMKIKARIA